MRGPLRCQQKRTELLLCLYRMRSFRHELVRRAKQSGSYPTFTEVSAPLQPHKMGSLLTADVDALGY